LPNVSPKKDKQEGTVIASSDTILTGHVPSRVVKVTRSCRGANKHFPQLSPIFENSILPLVSGYRYCDFDEFKPFPPLFPDKMFKIYFSTHKLSKSLQGVFYP